MTSERRRVLFGTSWTLLSTMVGLMVGVVLRPTLVAFVGVDGYGIWAFAIAISSLFGLVGDLGVSGALTKLVAERQGKREDTGTLAGSALLFALIAGSLAGLALASLSGLVARSVAFPGLSALLQILALQMPFNFGISSLMGLLQGRRRFQSLAVLAMSQSVGYLALSVLFLGLGVGLVGVMASSLLLSIVAFAFLFVLMRADLQFRGIAEVRRDLRGLVPFGVTLAATNALSTLLYQVDIVVLTFLVANPSVVGTYALAIFVTRALWIIPGTINLTTYPVVSEYAAARDRRRVTAYLSTALRASVAISGALATGLILFGRPVLRFLFGPESAPAYGLSLVLLLGTAFLGSLRSVAGSIPSVGRPDVGMRISALGVSLVLVLSLALTAIWGESGTAAAVSVSFVIVAAAVTWAINTYVISMNRSKPNFRSVVLTAAISMAMGPVAVLASLSEAALPSQVVVAVLVWIGTVAALGLASSGKEGWRFRFRPSVAHPGTASGGDGLRSRKISRAGRPLHVRVRSAIFLLPAWFSPSSSLRSAFHRLRGARISRSAEIGYFVIVDNLYPEKVIIEEHATVAARSTILSHDESLAYTGRGAERVLETRISQGSFVGVHCVILPGVTVGPCAIVGAGSVVTHDVPAGATVAGVPAKLIAAGDRPQHMS